MKVDNSCKHCELNFSGKCCGNGELEYGQPIEDIDKQRKCIQHSMDYCSELAAQLSDDDLLIFNNDPTVTKDDLFLRIETGSWNFPKGKRKLLRSDGTYLEY